MKRIYYILFALSAVFITACEKDSEGVSQITTYCEFEMKGDVDMFIPVGTTFTDPGCIAWEGETEVKVTSTSNINTNEIGMYTITYTAVNSDGFPATTTRNVNVCYPNMDIAGIWTAQIVRNGSPRGPYQLTLLPLSEKTFYITDLLGGWYWIGSGYGFTYAFPGVLEINDDNTLSIIEAHESAWGSVGVFSESVTPTYNPETKTINFVTVMSDTNAYLFNVTLTKN